MRKPRFIYRALLGALSLATATSLVTACDEVTYKNAMTVETCKGQSITVGQMEHELKLAHYDGRYARNNLDRELRDYNDAACGDKPVTTCKGESVTWFKLDGELYKANYPGPIDHGKAELAAYNRAACPERG